MLVSMPLNEVFSMSSQGLRKLFLRREVRKYGPVRIHDEFAWVEMFKNVIDLPNLPDYKVVSLKAVDRHGWSLLHGRIRWGAWMSSPTPLRNETLYHLYYQGQSFPEGPFTFEQAIARARAHTEGK